MKAALDTEKKHLIYTCPGCKHSHRVTINQPDSWKWNGDLEKPTITPSVLVNANRSNPEAHTCHHYVIDGKIQYLGDCTHELAVRIVDMEDV